MGAQAIIKIGPHGGKIVGFNGTTPIYMHEVTAGHTHDTGQFPPGSPFVTAQAAGLAARVHADSHDKVEIAWRNHNAAAAEKWLDAHPEAKAHLVKTSLGARVIVPRAWAAQAPKAVTVPAAAVKAAPKTPLATFHDKANNVSASVFIHGNGFSVAVKDHDSGETVPHFTIYPDKETAITAAKKIAGTQAAPKTPAKPAAPAPSPTPAPTHGAALLAAAGVHPVDKATLKNPIGSWKDSPNHPVTVGGKAGELVGWQTEGAPPAKTGKLVVRFPGPGPLGGTVLAYHPSEVTPVHTDPHAPWHHPEAKVYKSETVTAALKKTLAMAAPGQGGKSMAQVVGLIQEKGVPIFYMGGFVRDALQGKESKDIDLGFGTDASGITSIASSKKLHYIPPGQGGLVKLGAMDSSGVPPLEGKGLKGINADAVKLVHSAPSSTGTDLHAENIYGDFAHGRLWYDPVNDTIIDPTGHGVEDALTHTLRIPVPKEKWGDWAKGGPHKFYRYWKFRARGDKPVDQETHDFIVSSAKAAYESGAVESKAKKAAVQRGYLGYDPDSGKYPPDAQKKLDGARKACIEDMGQAFWDTHFAPYIPHGFK